MQNTLKQGYNEQYNITINSFGKLDVCIPTNKRVLLLDGKYNSSQFGEDFKSWTDCSFNHITRKILSFEKILPPQNKQEVEVIGRIPITSLRDDFYDNMTKEEINAYKQSMEYFSLLSEKIMLSHYSKSNSVWLQVFLHSEEEMSMECFNSILERCANPNYIIVTNDFVYEHLPSVGKPKDIDTSEGIVEAWEINGVTMFYMPLTGNMSETDILLWRKVLTEVLV